MQVILPEQLEQRDPAEIALPYGADGAVVPEQKLCTVMTDRELEYVLYGTEAQLEIHNAMAVRNNLYDALEILRQNEKRLKKWNAER